MDEFMDMTARDASRPPTERPSGFASPNQRAAALSVAVALHLVVLALLILLGTVRTRPVPPPPAAFDLSLRAAADDAGASAAGGALPPALPVAPMPVPSAPVPPVPVPPADPEPVAEPVPIDMATMVPVFDAEPDPGLTGDAPGAAIGKGASGDAASGDAGGGCSPSAAVRDMLERQAEARTALAGIPRPSRSVANAVLLWNGEWIAPDRIGGAAALGAIRGAIAEALNRAPEACRSQAEPGPVFLIVNVADSGSGPEPMVLAFGSNVWRWSDLLIEAIPKLDPSDLEDDARQ